MSKTDRSTTSSARFEIRPTDLRPRWRVYEADESGDRRERYVYEYRLLATLLIDDDEWLEHGLEALYDDETGERLVVHHIDHCSAHNVLENLEWRSPPEHGSYHLQGVDFCD